MSDTNTETECCENCHVKFDDRSVPDPNVYDNSKVSRELEIFARCKNCGALWVHRFQSYADIYEYTYEGSVDHPFHDIRSQFKEWEVSHVDKNKLHDDRAIVVYTPNVEEDNPIDELIGEKHPLSEDELKSLRDKIDFTDFKYKETYLYEESELVTSSFYDNNSQSKQ